MKLVHTFLEPEDVDSTVCRFLKGILEPEKYNNELDQTTKPINLLHTVTY